MRSVASFLALAERRRKNPVRESRRQAHLTRMRNRMDFVPVYREATNGRGEVVGQVYLGHRAVRAK